MSDITRDVTRLISVEGINNLRDLGGIPTGDGRTVRCRKLYRSATLTDATPAAIETLTRMGIKVVIDVRGNADFERMPDPIPPGNGTDVIRLPITNGHIDSLIPELKEIGEDDSRDGSVWMIRIYRSLPRDFQPQIADFLRLVCDSTHHPLLVHCSAGKDRTGFLVALVLSLLGVAKPYILGDYLLSNEGFDDPLSHLAHTGVADRLLRPIVEARPEYLQSSFDVIEQDYGGVLEYSRQTLGLTPAELQALRDTLLVEPHGARQPTLEANQTVGQTRP